MSEIQIGELDENLDLELDGDFEDESDLDLDFEDEIVDNSEEFKGQVDWLLGLNMNEVNSSSVFVSLKYISNHFLEKINIIINSKNKDELYDEVIMFKMVNDKIDDVKSPFFVNPPRNEQEGYSYIDNAETLISYIKSGDIEVNEPKEQEGAQGLDFDVLTVTDSGLLVFLNKKNGTTTKEELSTYVDGIKEMIKQFRAKLKI